MFTRILVVSALMVPLWSFSALSAVTPGPNHFDNPAGKEWLVRYDANENVSHFPKAKKVPDTGAIRLRITKTGGSYNAKLWRFKVSKMGGAHYELTGKAQVNLTIQGNHTGRRRIGFWSVPAALINPATGMVTHTVTINGIWQPGHTGARSEDRIQLKLYLVPAGGAAAPKEAPAPDAAPAKRMQSVLAPTSDCEEDPDTDVLEENGTPMGEDDPPPYDGDP